MISTRTPSSLDYSPLPASLREGVRRWVEDHVEPGDFLCAVIRNDFQDAIARADDDNLPLLPAIVRWFYQEAPGKCWGSKAAFDTWRAFDKWSASGGVA